MSAFCSNLLLSGKKICLNGYILEKKQENDKVGNEKY